MTRWFRVYNDLIEDPKVQRLHPGIFKALINLWCLASKNGGILPTAEDIAFSLRKDEGEVLKILKELCNRELIDRDGVNFKPHNWDNRQFNSDGSTDRVKRFRERQRNVSETFHPSLQKRPETVTVTPPDTDTESDTEVEKKETRARRADWPADYQQRFWDQYPNKVGKRKALSKLDRLSWSRDSPPFEELMAGLHRYSAKNDFREWMNPTTWLNGARWDDQLAEPAPKGNFNGRKQHPAQRAFEMADELDAATERQANSAGSITGGGTDVVSVLEFRRIT